MEQSPYYIQKLKDELTRRKQRSKSYSLRAFGRDLGIHPSTLSLVMKNTRELPRKYVNTIAEELSLDMNEHRLFVQSLETKLKSHP